MQSSPSELEQYIGLWPIVMIQGRNLRFSVDAASCQPKQCLKCCKLRTCLILVWTMSPSEHWRTISYIWWPLVVVFIVVCIFPQTVSTSNTTTMTTRQLQNIHTQNLWNMRNSIQFSYILLFSSTTTICTLANVFKICKLWDKRKLWGQKTMH